MIPLRRECYRHLKNCEQIFDWGLDVLSRTIDELPPHGSSTDNLKKAYYALSRDWTHLCSVIVKETIDIE